MTTLAGKKTLCFIALPHHNRFLVPIMEALAREGMEIIYFTAAAEGAFEITLNQAKLPYKHLFDYATNATASAISEAYRELRSVLQPKLLASRTVSRFRLLFRTRLFAGQSRTFTAWTVCFRLKSPHCCLLFTS